LLGYFLAPRTPTTDFRIIKLEYLILNHFDYARSPISLADVRFAPEGGRRADIGDVAKVPRPLWQRERSAT